VLFRSIGEVDEAIDFLRFYCHLVEQNQGLIINRRLHAPRRKVGDFGHQGARSIGERIKIVSKPFGVWGVIAPFNFPLSISTGMCAAAIITGNTVVFKPSFGDNPTPLTGIRMYQIFAAARLPDGVLNCVTGSGNEVGNELVENDGVKGLAFTGSREVGLRMQRRAVDRSIPKQFVAEMGSKNPVIVTATADLDKAVTGIAHAAFGYAGQKCSACSRALVHESVYDKFLNQLTRLVKKLKIGDPLKRETYIGPLVGRAAFERYIASMKKARAEGRIIWGGSSLRGKVPFDNGYYVEPAIVEVDQKSELFRRELFLPILAVVRFNGFEEAIELANETEYGLTAGLYTGDQEEIDYFNNNIEFGTTYVNRDVSATTGAIVGQQSFVWFKGSSLRCKGTSSLS
jgi:1-pyrroline-5-carboxylate dehydrogenase